VRRSFAAAALVKGDGSPSNAYGSFIARQERNDQPLDWRVGIAGADRLGRTPNVGNAGDGTDCAGSNYQP
jgi:hypothetical protein